MNEILALRIYGQHAQGVLVAAEREYPALRELEWVFHRDAGPRIKEVSPPRGREGDLVRVTERFAYLQGRTARQVARQLAELPVVLAYVWNGNGWRRVSGDTPVTPFEAERLGLLSVPGELNTCAN